LNRCICKDKVTTVFPKHMKTHIRAGKQTKITTRIEQVQNIYINTEQQQLIHHQEFN